jgi:hypothetical protein
VRTTARSLRSQAIGLEMRKEVEERRIGRRRERLGDVTIIDDARRGDGHELQRLFPPQRDDRTLKNSATIRNGVRMLPRCVRGS